MDPEIIRANHIIKNATQYVTDGVFRQMVNGTVYLTTEEKEKSQLEIDRVYGYENYVGNNAA